MEFFELIRIGTILEGLNSCFVVFAFSSFIVILVSFAGLQTYNDVPKTAQRFKNTLIGASISFVLSVFFAAVTPDSSSYYLEAKYKLYHTQTLSLEERDQLMKQVDKLIEKEH